MSEAKDKVPETVIFWFRRDLRLEDNTALEAALASGYPVVALFILDTDIVDELERDDPRLSFIYDRLSTIHRELVSRGSALHVHRGKPLKVLEDITKAFTVRGVFTNRDYEPYARHRDMEVSRMLESRSIAFQSFKDQVIFEQDEILKKDGKPYTVFTPYKRKWLEAYSEMKIAPAGVPASGEFLKGSAPFPGLDALGFRQSDIRVAPCDLSVLPDYARLRDYPAAGATSHLGPHLRFGTVSIRKIISSLGDAHDVFLSELIWREFFMQILYHFPHVVTQNFNRKYDGLAWRNREEEWERWCEGTTGYPLVDAGMRELGRTGTMHNRVRMVVAGFLCKHLLIDWRWGEAFFAGKLLDYELSSNNGNWQWAAGTGCDAAPYFRVFNPAEQLKKFDAEREYVRKWVPEYGTADYPPPMVDHKFARERAIRTYRDSLQG